MVNIKNVNKNDLVEVLLRRIGWRVTDKKTGKVTWLGQPMYHAILDAKLLGDILKMNIESGVYNGLSDSIQRRLEQAREEAIADMASGRVQLNGAPVDIKSDIPYDVNNLPLQAIIDVTSAEVVETRTVYDGTDWVEEKRLILPRGEAVKLLAKYYRVIDGQHSSAAFSKNSIKKVDTDEKIYSYDMPVIVFLDLSEEDKVNYFDIKNFKAKVAAPSQRYDHQIINKRASESEIELAAIVDILAEKMVVTEASMKRGADTINYMRSPLYGNVKLSETDAGMKITRAQIRRYAMSQGNSKKELPREKNWYISMSGVVNSKRNHFGCQGRDAYAAAQNLYMLNFMRVNGSGIDGDVNMFIPKRPSKNSKETDMSPTKCAIAFALAQPCADVLNAHNMQWNSQNISAVLRILNREVLGVDKFTNVSPNMFAGGHNAYSNTMEMMKELVKRCENASADEILERGKPLA